jgi:hypothetical protein
MIALDPCHAHHQKSKEIRDLERLFCANCPSQKCITSHCGVNAAICNADELARDWIQAGQGR